MINDLFEKAYLVKRFLWSLKTFKILNKNKRGFGKPTILIIKPDAIGDYILFRNFLKNLRESKNERIVLIGNSLWKSIFEKFDRDFVDEFISLGKDKILFDGKSREKILKQLQKYNIKDVLYPVFDRQFEIDYLISKIDAEEKWAFKGGSANMLGIQKLISDKYYDTLIEIPSGLHEFYRNKFFFEDYLGEEINEDNPKINFEKRLSKRIIVCPGASSKLRRWNPKNFSKIIDYLLQKYNFEIVIVGSQFDKNLAEEIISNSKYPSKIVDETGGSLIETIRLISESRGILSNETGTVHIAVALGKKVLCLSNGNHYGRFHPYPRYADARYIYPKGFSKKKLTLTGRCFEDIEKIDLAEVKKKSRIFA